jgi:hypothetical protein
VQSIDAWDVVHQAERITIDIELATIEPRPGNDASSG